MLVSPTSGRQDASFEVPNSSCRGIGEAGDLGEVPARPSCCGVRFVGMGGSWHRDSTVGACAQACSKALHFFGSSVAWSKGLSY